MEELEITHSLSIVVSEPNLYSEQLYSTAAIYFRGRTDETSQRVSNNHHKVDLSRRGINAPQVLMRGRRKQANLHRVM
ncbi:hypothetical protein APHCRT_1076 [Anaplasma phagocytophilum str. CRT53-1]|uniref:Uncharacterized protein n=3 Tax=Anaplasma phagocytophilum TaxID=948 RepID=S6G844_ANAPH|nr:hypothetical protein YYU_05725 [Anaplasma phagocytophilum str. HZ2]AGR80962.1 hypothetical protein WSQ_05790 [Anaplasma phagocytophilum str. JM]AGR82218.1 hypothetical protein YYY_05800 [Anaplasma phagocytophilum str. Dog2]EOA61463.1 hypothetical protein HGE1_05417 [Anaplasma phagocytophilum str. HGE1]EOA62377.1 hypothetical protein CRT38_03892 [Anaplasma phagocytophilum str. CRT38]KDB55650.1 hypothetical protein O997_05800 [Anaplasma phagocytophilum str. MRK]KDB56403.1 hypothetical protei